MDKNLSLRERNKNTQLGFSESQQQRVNLGEEIVLRNMFYDLKIQLKNPNKVC